MKARKLLTWIEGTNANVAVIYDETEDSFTVGIPMVVVNSVYSVLADGTTPCRPEDPNRIGGPNDPDKTHKESFSYKVDLMPYLFTGYVGAEAKFTLNKKTSLVYSVVEDEEVSMYKQYFNTVASYA